MANLVEAIQEKCNEIRDVLLPAYDDIGVAGAFGAAMLRLQIKESEDAIASGEVVRMVQALHDLNEIKF